MKSSVEPVEGNKVKLSIEVDSATFEHEVDAAFKRIAREVRIPGFRPGKAPRKLLEARIGTEAARGDALEHALPRYYAEAVQEHDVDVIAPPEIDITSGQEEGDVVFDAVVEVRPTVRPAGYESLRVTIDSPEVADEDVDARIERLRDGFSRLEAVERPAQPGDHVTIDITGAREGEPIEGLVAEDYLYEVGAGTVVPELDEHLAGAAAGDELQFTADHPEPDQDPIDFTVAVKEVKEKVLPDVDDAFAAEASEFETLAELRVDLAEKLAVVKRMQSTMQVQQRTADALGELVTEEIPDALVNTEVQHRVQDMAMRLQAQGFSLEEYLATLGQGQQEFVDELKEAATRAVKVDLALRAIAQDLEVEVTDDDLEQEFANVAAQVGRSPEQVRRDFERGGQMSAVRSDLRQRKALEWLIERVELVDEGGSAVDRASLELGSPADDEAPTEDAE